MGQSPDDGVAWQSLAAAASTPAVGLENPADEHGTIGGNSLAGELPTELVEVAGRGQVRASEGSLEHWASTGDRSPCIGVGLGVVFCRRGSSRTMVHSEDAVHLRDLRYFLEAWDIGNAILAFVNQAELSHPYVRRCCLEESGSTAAVKAGRRLRKENQEDHDRLRAGLGAG